MLETFEDKLRGIFRRPSPARDFISLYHWSPNAASAAENFGDSLSPVIVRHVLDELEVQSSCLGSRTAGETGRRLLGIGSIIHHARDNDVIWGSGVNGKDLGWRRLEASNLDIRMVRGPLTRRFLRSNGIECPERYGEPGLLLSRYYSPAVATDSIEYVIIPNIRERDFYKEHGDVVDPTSEWREVVDRICQSNLVVSSSLHGLVVAESYGIPARHLLSLTEPTFKYRDYYEGTGRTDVKFAHTVEEALSLGGVPEPEYSASEMLAVFPADLLET